MKKILLAVLSLVFCLCLLVLCGCEHECEFSREWSFDEYEHWRACKDEQCNKTAREGAHLWGDGVITTQPTLEQTGIKTFACAVCGYTKEEVVEKLPCPHSPSDDWASDATGHWRTCTDCDDKVEQSEHIFDNGADICCNVCSFVRDHECVTGNIWQKDQTSHWGICGKEGCDKKVNVENHYYDDEMDILCNGCDFVREHECIADGSYRMNDQQHWHPCAMEGCDKELEFEDHVYDDDVDTRCNVCPYDRPEHECVPCEDWLYNTTNHYKTCTANGCTTTVVSENHLFDNAADTTCNVCDYERPVHRCYTDGVWHRDETHHWYACTITGCGARIDVGTHSFDRQVPTEEYLAVAATDSSPAMYYMSCVCGLAGSERFVYVEPVHARANQIRERITFCEKA